MATEVLRASQEPLGPSQSPSFFLETSESKSASCLPRVKRPTVLLPSPSHWPLPPKQCTSWLKASGRECCRATPRHVAWQAASSGCHGLTAHLAQTPPAPPIPVQRGGWGFCGDPHLPGLWLSAYTRSGVLPECLPPHTCCVALRGVARNRWKSPT